MACPLCSSTNIREYWGNDNVSYLECIDCSLVFKDPNTFLSGEEEKARYLQHNNDVNDLNYQNFVSPIVDSVLKDFNSDSYGLDFGAGPGPVITKMLIDKGYTVELYDPFFHPDKRVLNSTYNFIVCCEVMEHFHRPAEEFKKLRKLLKKGGKLYCMTEFLPPKDKFKLWYYKNDPTHVVFYSEENVVKIKELFNFSEVQIFDRTIVFSI